MLSRLILFVPLLAHQAAAVGTAFGYATGASDKLFFARRNGLTSLLTQERLGAGPLQRQCLLPLLNWFRGWETAPLV